MSRFRWLWWAIVLAFSAVPVAHGQPLAPAEAATVAKIESLGGRVYRNAAFQVDIADLKGKKFGDEHLEMLQSLPALRNLSLDGSRVTDQGLEHLLKLPALEEVSLLRTAVTPAAAQSLKVRHGKIFYVALSPRSGPAILAIIPLLALPVGLLGIWLFRAAQRKRDVLAPRTYVQGIAYGLLLLIVASGIMILAIAKSLGFNFHLSDLGG